MAVTLHVPDHSPPPVGSACSGYPPGVWPPVLSAFCADSLIDKSRHDDCSLPGCICPGHAINSVGQEKKAKDNASDALNEEKAKSGHTTGQRLEQLGSNRDSTRVPPRR
jgi:hypothetical protein